MRPALGLAAALIVALLVGVTAAGANTLQVTNNNDSGPGSLRQAISDAGSDDTIVVPANTYTLTSGALVINKALTISGAGAATTILSGNNNSQVLVLQNAGNVTVSGVTVTHGNLVAPSGIAQGGGIATDANSNLTLTGVVVSGNTADASGTSSSGGIGQGGGIYHAGNLTVVNSTISGNFAKALGPSGKGGGISEGGGIFDDAPSPRSLSLTNVSMDSNSSDASAAGGGSGGIAEGGSIENRGPATLSRVTISRSVALARATGAGGGGIAEGGGIEPRDVATLTNVTITGNNADASGGATGSGGPTGGGGVEVRAAVTFVNDTVNANSLTSGGGTAGSRIGGNIVQSGGSLNVKNTIVAAGGAAPGEENCAGTIVSSGHNVDSLDQCGFHASGDHVNTPPALGPLQNNGGSTETLALLAGSPAINSGDNSGCPATDARGVTRPQQTVCDIGAYEFAPPLASTGGANPPSQTAATVTGAVTPNLRDTTYYFEYGLTTSYGSKTAPGAAGSGNASVPVSAALAGLTPNKTYHYRVVATNADATTAGADMTFASLPVPAAGKLAVKPTSFPAAPKGSSLAAAGKRRKRTYGTRVSFQLNTPASVKFTVQVPRAGRRDRKGRCVAHTRRNRRARRCTRYVTMSGSFTITGKAGTNTFRFTGRLKGKRLKPGRYYLVATPSAGGTTGRALRVAFRIVK
jgi:hypothetical protein